MLQEMSEFEKKRFNVIKGKLDKAANENGVTTTEAPTEVKNEDDFLNKKLLN